MLNNAAARRVASVAIDPLAKGLLALRIHPDAVTIAGTAGTCVGALAFFPRGEFVIGVVIIAVCALCDLVDGTMARISGTSGPWGNFLDSTLDRVADGAIFGGLLLWAALQDDTWTAAAALACLVAGQVVSYAKARAESVGATANVGIVERPERLIVGVGAALLAGLGLTMALPIALWALGALSAVTVVQRMAVVRRQLRQAPDQGLAS